MIHFSLFRDRASRSISRKMMHWHDFAHDILHHMPEFKDKHSCPLISLTEYGDAVSMLGSYRHTANALQAHGIEGDYDAGEVPPRDAYLRMVDLRIKALIVTTPGHAPAAPRWRVLMPLSRPCPIEQRRSFVERLNGALHGILAPESGTATQCFYVGKVVQTAAYFEAYQSFGRCIDTASDILPARLAINDRESAATPTSKEWNALSREAQYETIRDAFLNKDGRHEAARRLATMMAQDGADAETIREELTALLGTDTRGGEHGERDLARDIRSLPEWAVRKIGAPKADNLARAAAALPGLMRSLQRNRNKS